MKNVEEKTLLNAREDVSELLEVSCLSESISTTMIIERKYDEETSCEETPDCMWVCREEIKTTKK